MFVIYPGSFDPLTLGHEDIIKRAASSFDQVMIAVSEDNAKTSIFSVKERLKMAEIIAKKYTNVSASSFKGLTVDLAKANTTNFILRGVRLVGIDSVECKRAKKLSAWEKLAFQFKINTLEEITTEIRLEEIQEAYTALLEGRAVGRYVVKI